MKYNRKQRSLNPIDILKFETVETGAVFKQYDVNTSILEIALVANGEPVRIDNSFKIYATVKPRQRSTYDVLYRYSENYEENEISNYKILLNAEKMKVRSLNNMINLYLSPLALSFSGDMVAELILVDLENQQRVTSQEFTFKIESSLTPNQQEEISYTVIEDLGGTYITDSEELKLLAIDGVSGFKLSFTGTEVDKILKDVEGFSHDENNQSLEALKQKGEELQESIGEAKEERKLINSKIKLLENKDALLDVEIEKLKSYDSTNDSNIEEIKSNISELEGYNSTNDEKIQSIDREIKSLKEYNSSNSTKIQSIENEIRSLKKYDETNTSSINKIKEDIVNLKSYNSSNDESIRNINSNIESLKQYNSNNTEVVNGIKSDLQNYKSSNNQAISGVRENLESYKASNNQSVNSINENLESFKNTTNQTVNDINVDISSLKNYNTTNNSRIEEINRSIERNANSISENLQKINSNTSLIEVNKETISSINLKNKEIERDLASSKENIKNNKNDILNLNKKVNKNIEDIKLLKEGSIGGSSSTNSNKEVIDARTATTGEVFNTLDERIDNEVDRLNKKIDVAMLQQEDKESHTIENTVDGMTTDMIVKGKTLQNVIPKVNFLDTNATYNTDSVTSVILVREDMEVPVKANSKYTVLFKVNFSSLTLSKFYLQVNVLLNTGVQTSIVYRIISNSNYSGEIFKSVVTIPENSKSIKSVFLGGSEGSIDINSGGYCMIFEGEMSDIPDNYFEGIKSFGETEGNKISILSSGKNLFSEYDTAIFVSKGEYVVSSSMTEGAKRLRIKCKKEDLSNFGGMYYDASGNYQTHQDSTQINNLTFTVTRDCYLTFKYLNGLEKPYNNIQLEKGRVSTTYKPYKCDKKDILLQNLGFDEGLRGLNNSVYDELNDIKNVAIKRIGKHIFTGNETIRQLENSTKALIVLVENIKGVDSKHFISNSNIGYEARWNVNEWENNYPIAFNFKDSSAGSMSLLISKSKIPSVTDIDSLKQYLRENNIELYYQLKEPIETPLSENINLKTFGERTYISFENAISGTSSFKAPVDTKATIARLNRENRALEEENKTLRQDFESTTLSLTDSDLELVKQNVDIDFRLMEVEFALDIPQSTLSSNINFKKKGEVKSMARTPYEMMKIVILSGDYDREDYIHKVGKYYERGRMTKEEYDELMSLMTADEVISKKI